MSTFFDAKELVMMLIESGRYNIIDDILGLLFDMRDNDKELNARGQILDRMEYISRGLGCKNNGWNQSLDFLAEKAGYEIEVPF